MNIRHRILGGMMVGAALCGALAGAVLTWMGNRIADAPFYPSAGQYLWNGAVFAVLAALISPLITWTVLRRVPLWRTIVEPAVAGLVATVFAMLTVPGLFLVMAPGAMLASVFRLEYRYRRQSDRILPRSADTAR